MCNLHIGSHVYALHCDKYVNKPSDDNILYFCNFVKNGANEIKFSFRILMFLNVHRFRSLHSTNDTENLTPQFSHTTKDLSFFVIMSK
jgi:hypothetical protein